MGRMMLEKPAIRKLRPVVQQPTTAWITRKLLTPCSSIMTLRARSRSVRSVGRTGLSAPTP